MLRNGTGHQLFTAKDGVHQPFAVSVCILTCNQERYIQQCLDSVIIQSGDATLEILVGDDCSGDSTSSIIAAVAERNRDMIVHLRHDQRLGACANLRSLLLRARGDFIAVLDGDDYWLPGKLKAQLAYLQMHPDCVGVYTNAKTVTENGQAIGVFNDAGNRTLDLSSLLRRGNFLNASSALLRADLRQGLLAIDGPYIDYRAHLLHARKGMLAQIGRPLTAYRVNSMGSLVSGSNDVVRHLYWEAIMDVPRDLVTDDDFANGVADFLRRVIFRSIRTRRWKLVREWAPRVFAASPYGRLRTSLLVLGAAMRSIYVESWGRLRGSLGGHAEKVLYRR